MEGCAVRKPKIGTRAVFEATHAKSSHHGLQQVRGGLGNDMHA